MLVPCYCGNHMLNPEHADYVKEGKPLCLAITCERSNKRVEAELTRRETATRIVGTWDGGFYVVN